MGWKTFRDRLALIMAVVIYGSLAALTWVGKIDAVALLALSGPLLVLIIQFYFRKSGPGETPPGGNSGGTG